MKTSSPDEPEKAKDADAVAQQRPRDRRPQRGVGAGGEPVPEAPQQRIGQAGVVYDVVTTGGEHDAGAPPALWAVPGGATGYVVVTDVMGVVDFYDQRSELGAAADRGEDISAQPIRVP